MNILAKSLLLGFITVAGLKAQTGFLYYKTDFSSNGSTIPANQSYTPTSPLPTTPDTSFQDGWFSGLGDGTANINWLAPAGISSNNQLFVGGAQILNDPYNGYYAPTNQTTFAKRDISNMGFAQLGNSVSFSSTILIQASTNGNYDNFGWTLFNSAGFQLVSFDFNVTNTGGVISYNIGASSYANDTPIDPNGNILSQALIANGPAATNTGGQLNIMANTNYAFRFDVANIGLTNQSVSIWSYNSGLNAQPTALATNQLLQGNDFSTNGPNNGDTNIVYAGLTWSINNTNLGGSNGDQFVNFGDNALYVSYFSVPEPSTWMLMGISGLIMVVALRRKKA